MAILLLLALALVQGSSTNSPSSPPPEPSAAKSGDIDSSALLKVKRIYVDSFGDDANSKEMQSMIVTALVSSKRFTVTENHDRADATLKGVALATTSQEAHAFGESTAVRNAAISDSSLHTQTIDHARLAIRLVNADGDVIWTTTQESKGAKYKGATADAADLCVKQLLRDATKSEVVGPQGVEKKP